MVESSRRVRPWREAVKFAVLDQHRCDEPSSDLPVEHQCPLPWHGPVEVDVLFRLPRPRSHFRTGRHADELRDDAPLLVASRPDVDKLLRSTFDALGEAGVWADDSQVARVVAVKTYAAPGELTGARIVVRAGVGER